MQSYQDKSPAPLRKVVSWLRNSSGLKVRAGVIDGQRKEYFKGKNVIKVLCSEGYKKYSVKHHLPRVDSEEQAVALLSSLLPFAFFLRVDKGGKITTKSAGQTSPTKVRQLSVNRSQEIKAEHYYAWLIEAGQLKLLLFSFIAVSILFAGVLFPLWPPILRLGVWYLSMGVMGLVGGFMGLAVIRLVLFILSWFVLSPGLWIFPNLFEDVGVIESFVPFWEWDGVKAKPKKKSKKRDKEGGAKGKTDKEGSNGKPDLTSSVVAPPPPSQATSDKDKSKME